MADLKIEVVRQGEGGRVTKKGEAIKMHYEGKLDSGQEFDSSYKRQQPFEFTLGAGQVIAGWDQGLEGMSKGEVRQLTIPANLGYGDHGYPPVIPPKSTLHFRVELVDWK